MHWPHSSIFEMEMHLQNRIQRRWQNLYRYMLILNRSWWISITVDISEHVELTLFMYNVTPICGRNVNKSITGNIRILIHVPAEPFLLIPWGIHSPKLVLIFFFLLNHKGTTVQKGKHIFIIPLNNVSWMQLDTIL